MAGNKGISNHAKASCRLVKTIPVFLIAFLFPEVTTALKEKRFQDAEDIKKNVTAELNGVRLEAFANCFQNPFTFKRFDTCNHAGGNNLNRNKTFFFYFLVFFIYFFAPRA
jgi:hypothetical protein